MTQTTVTTAAPDRALAPEAADLSPSTGGEPLPDLFSGVGAP